MTVSADVQNNGKTTGGVTGKGFRPGKSGNPGGRPRGIARITREKLGEDGEAIVDFWIEAMNDTALNMRERLEASKLLAERGWGKAVAVVLVDDEDNQRDADLEAAVEQFYAEVERLSAQNQRERRDVEGVTES
jgi:hypothetical protein